MSGNHDGGHHPEPESAAALRAKALESLLVDKGLLSCDAIDRVVSAYEQDIRPLIGAKIVARAWVDPEFKRRLLEDANEAIAEMGYGGNDIVVLENTPGLHNVVVCTLCSCYPWAVLGLPPTWYKSPPYRARAAADPRGVLAEFGVTLPETTRIRVWDSTAEIRYLVVPMRPAGTDGWSEAELARLVTRDSMIGTGLALAPEAAAR